jgi:SAM-dependent methyltransferase
MGEDREAIRNFEQARWQKAAARYRATFAHATAEFVAVLLDAAAVMPGVQVLDLACGPGLAAAAAARRRAQVFGLDFSQAMLREARRAHPQIRLIAADAEALPLASASLDAVIANFGLHHVPDPIAAAAEACRLLRPGGRFAFTAWAAPPENAAWKLLFDAIAAHGDPHAAKAPPPGGGLRTAKDAGGVLHAAGFARIEAQTVRRRWRVADAGGLLDGFRQGTVRTAAMIAAQPPAAMPAIEAAIARDIAAFRETGGFAVPIVAILAAATK